MALVVVPFVPVKLITFNKVLEAVEVRPPYKVSKPVKATVPEANSPPVFVKPLVNANVARLSVPEMVEEAPFTISGPET